MMKNNIKKIKFIFIIVIFILLAISNIYFIYKYIHPRKESVITEKFIYKEIDDEYNKDKKYYTTINYAKFKQYYQGKDIKTIAIIDNSSKTYDKFIETINKIGFYKNTNIYLLEISKLSKKNEIAFYEIDDRFSNLQSNFIITVKNKKILSLTTFSNIDLNLFVEGIGE